jgi:hypothetical protein
LKKEDGLMEAKKGFGVFSGVVKHNSEWEAGLSGVVIKANVSSPRGD